MGNKYQLGDVVEVEVTPRNFGRIAAQAAKQVIVQRTREAERSMYDEYIEKEAEILTAIVLRIKQKPFPSISIAPRACWSLLSRCRMEFPCRQSHQGLRHGGQPRWVRGSCRTDAGLVKRLFEMEVPEIQTGIADQVHRARRWIRTKMAVSSTPITHGRRVRPLKPSSHTRRKGRVIGPHRSRRRFSAKVVGVFVNEHEKAAKVVVLDNSVSAEKEGQETPTAGRQAHHWRIDIEHPQDGREHGGVKRIEAEENPRCACAWAAAR